MRARYRNARRFRGVLVSLVWVSGLCIGTGAWAEQKERFGDVEVHYVVIPTTFLTPAVAERYNVVRARDRALVNLSIIDVADGKARSASVTGTATNLLSQAQALNFVESREGDAIYYLAQLTHDNQDLLRFEIHIHPNQRREQVLKFQQKLHWED